MTHLLVSKCVKDVFINELCIFLKAFFSLMRSMPTQVILDKSLHQWQLFNLLFYGCRIFPKGNFSEMFFSKSTRFFSGNLAVNAYFNVFFNTICIPILNKVSDPSTW